MLFKIVNMIQSIIRIKKHISCFGGFQLLIGEKYHVLYEGESKEGEIKRKVYLVESNVVKNKMKLPIAVYESECELVLKLTK